MDVVEVGGASPFFIVRNVPAALAFYRDKFGFTHRFCYAKRYLPAVPVHGNNLANVMLAGYNQEHDVTTPAWWESV